MNAYFMHMPLSENGVPVQAAWTKFTSNAITTSASGRTVVTTSLVKSDVPH